MKKYVITTALLTGLLFAGTYDDPYTPVKQFGVTAEKHVDPFFDGSFEEIIRFEALHFSDGSFSEDSDENFDNIVSKIKDYLSRDEKIKVKVIGHARDMIEISEEEEILTADAKTYVNVIQAKEYLLKTKEESIKNSDDYATHIENKLLDNDIDKEVLVKEYRSSKDLGYTIATDEGKELSNRVMVTMYVLERDDDKDGVLNANDKCPDTPEGVKVDKDGCCIDSDKDGVCDYKDECPDTPEGVAVDEKGCCIDSDKDGVCDYLDECPDTEEGLSVDENGCPPTITLDLNYETDSAIIPESSYHKVVEFAEFMNKYTPYNAKIVGHTDSRESDAYNIDLSKRRANGVKAALIKEGVSADRLETEGRGEAEPIQSNMTKEGRAENRRTEVELIK